MTTVSAWAMVVEIGFWDSPRTASPTWTDISAAVMAADGVTLTRGATSGEQASAGQFSLTLSAETLTTIAAQAVQRRIGLGDVWLGVVDSTLASSGAGMLRRPIRFRARNSAGTTYELGRFHVTDTVTLRDGVKRIRVSGVDAFALWGEATRGGDTAYHLSACGAVRRWKLDDEGPVARDDLGSGVELVETNYADGAGGSDTYGTVTWGNPAVPCPSGAGVVAIEPADILGNGGFTGLAGQLPNALPIGISFWMRLPEAPNRPSTYPPPPFNMFIPAIQLKGGSGWGRWFGFWIDGNGAVWADQGAGSNVGYIAIEVGYNWVHVDYQLTAAAAYCTLTLADGTSIDAASSVEDDPTLFPAGFTSLVLGGADYLVAGEQLFKPAAVELSDVIVWTGGATNSGMVRAAIGWPGETPSARLSRVASEAGFTAPTMTSTTTPPMTSAADARTTVLESLREVEAVTLGLLHLKGDGTAKVLIRSELDDAASSATLPGSLVLRESDGVTNSSEMIVNSSTVTAAHVADKSAAAQDATSVTDRGERADDRTMATADTDWLTLAAGWLANRWADPSASYGLPQLVVDPDELARRRPTGDPVTTLPWTADVGTVLTLTDVADTTIQARIMAVSWALGATGQWRCTWTVVPHGATDYFDIDTDDIDGTAILGW